MSPNLVLTVSSYSTVFIPFVFQPSYALNELKRKYGDLIKIRISNDPMTPGCFPNYKLIAEFSANTEWDDL